MKKIIVFLVLSMVVLSSCGSKLRYFTNDLYREFRWTDNELSRIQFYVSEDIVLQRKLSGESARIKDGKIRVVNGSEIEEIVIEKGTPGVFLESPKDGKFAISFDSGNESKFLMFGPNEKANGRYVLLAKDWEKKWGTITYGDKTYETSAASAYAALMVDIKKAQKLRVKSQRAKGNKVN